MSKEMSVHMYVCGVPNKKISIFGMYAKWGKKYKM